MGRVYIYKYCVAVWVVEMGDYRFSSFPHAVIRHDITLVKQLLREGNENIEEVEGGMGHQFRAKTALGFAAYQGDIPMMELLLRNHADPNGVGTGPHKRDPWGSEARYYVATPLFAAVQARSMEAIRLLFKHGADANQAESRNADLNYGGGDSAMKYAAQHGLLGIAKLLKANGASLGALYPYSKHASDHGYPEMAAWFAHGGMSVVEEDVEEKHDTGGVVRKDVCDTLVDRIMSAI